MENVSVPKISNFYGFSYAYTVAFRNPITEGIAECIPKLIEKYFWNIQFSLTKQNILPLKLIVPHMKTDVIDKPLSNFK